MLKDTRTLLLALLVGFVLSIYAGTYSGPYDDLRLRLYDIYEQQPYGNVVDPKVHTATPLWTDFLAAWQPAGTSVRLAAAWLIAICFFVMLAGRAGRPDIALLALLPAMYGGIAQGSFEAMFACFCLLAIRLTPPVLQVLLLFAGTGLLMWGNDTATWDVVNLHAAIGGLRQPLGLPGFFIGVISWLAAIAFLWPRINSNATLDWHTRGAVLILISTMFLPGMVRGIEWIAVAFLWFGWQSHGRGLRAMSLLSLVLLMDAYGLRAFYAIVLQVPNAMSPDAVHTMPAFVASFLTKVVVIRWLLWSPKTAASAVTNWRQLLSAFDRLPMRRWRGSRFVVVALVGFCTLINFSGRGDQDFPQTTEVGQGKMQVALGAEQKVAGVWIAMLDSKTRLQIWCQDTKTLDVEISRDFGLVWLYRPLSRPCVGKLIIQWEAGPEYPSISELVFVDEHGAKVTPNQVCPAKQCEPATNSVLFDEQADLKLPPHPNGGLWEETYNAAPGIGLMLGLTLESSHTSHPYLGRWLIYQSMQTFGINPLGWRAPSAIASALLVFFLFLVARELLKDEWWASFAVLLFSLDLLPLGIGRLGVTEGILSCFQLLSIACVLKALRRRREPEVALRWMIAAGLALAAATGTKWSGLFVAPIVGLATVWWLAQSRAQKKWRRHAVIYLVTVSTFGVMIYGAPYLPFLESGSIKEFVDHQQRVFNVQTDSYATVAKNRIEAAKQKAERQRKKREQQKKLENKGETEKQDPAANAATQLSTVKNTVETNTPSATPVQQAITSPSPVHLNTAGLVDWWGNQVTHTLSFRDNKPRINRYLFGNPVVWWLIPICFFAAWFSARLSSIVRVSAFFHLVPMVPWFFIVRPSFIYHYLTPLCLGCVLIAATVQHLAKANRQVALLITIAALACFVAFLPAIWGNQLEVTPTYDLRWFSRWFIELDS